MKRLFVIVALFFTLSVRAEVDYTTKLQELKTGITQIRYVVEDIDGYLWFQYEQFTDLVDYSSVIPIISSDLRTLLSKCDTCINYMDAQLAFIGQIMNDTSSLAGAISPFYSAISALDSNVFNILYGIGDLSNSLGMIYNALSGSGSGGQDLASLIEKLDALKSDLATDFSEVKSILNSQLEEIRSIRAYNSSILSTLQNMQSTLNGELRVVGDISVDLSDVRLDTGDINVTASVDLNPVVTAIDNFRSAFDNRFSRYADQFGSYRQPAVGSSEYFYFATTGNGTEQNYTLRTESDVQLTGNWFEDVVLCLKQVQHINHDIATGGHKMAALQNHILSNAVEIFKYQPKHFEKLTSIDENTANLLAELKKITQQMENAKDEQEQAQMEAQAEADNLPKEDDGESYKNTKFEFLDISAYFSNHDWLSAFTGVSSLVDQQVSIDMGQYEVAGSSPLINHDTATIPITSEFRSFLQCCRAFSTVCIWFGTLYLCLFVWKYFLKLYNLVMLVVK